MVVLGNRPARRSENQRQEIPGNLQQLFFHRLDHVEEVLSNEIAHCCLKERVPL
jgi:hypothetical protein